MTATGNESVQTARLDVESELATYFDDGTVMYQWQPHRIATSHEIEPGQTWSVLVAVPVVDDSHFQTVSCRVVSQ